MLKTDLEDNSSEALWHFAIIASSGDEVFSKTEKEALFSSVVLTDKLISKIAKIQGASSKNLSKRVKKYVAQIELTANETKSKISTSDIEFISSKITLLSLQPVAIALAIVVAGSDGLAKGEEKIIRLQNEEWGCDEKEVCYFIDFFKN